MDIATDILGFNALPEDPHSSSSPPLYQTATFCMDDAAGGSGAYDYSRSGNPTRTALERTLARIERPQLEGPNRDASNGVRAFAFTSGMAALTTAVSLVKPGKEILAGDDLYGGAYRLLTQVIAPTGTPVRFVDTTDTAATLAGISDRTGLVLLESPTNPQIRIVDIRAIASAARARGAITVVDNSAMTPLLQRPLALGADVSMHSATKFYNGHADVTAGTLAAAEGLLADRIAFLQNATGNALAPMPSWLLLRGIQTMRLRMDRQGSSAATIASFLDGHACVDRVHFPGLRSHPGAELHASQASGPGSLLSFEAPDAETARRLIERTSCFKVTVSFGSVASTICSPAATSHSTVPANERARRGLTDNLVRISIGIEHPDDLIADLSSAFDS